ncbi:MULTISPECIES: hypothetical protein [unclassified Spiroplasma]|uniref:hypothetical protein n=1 Tax=unclassified Spiroplasma TaxID=2637901 RepID=UPI00313D61AA
MVKRWLNILIVTVFSLGIGTNLIACSSQTMAKNFIKEEITNNQLLNEEINALKRKIAILTNDFQELIKKNNVTKKRIGQQESEIVQLIEYTSELTKLISSFGSGELADIAKLLKDNATLEDKLHHIRTEMARLLNKEELIAKNDALKVKIVSTYLEQFNANNRFDLSGLNINQQRSYALDKVKIKLQEKFPNIFKHISNLEIYNETWTLGKNAIEVFKDGNTALEIRFKIGVKTSQWIPMYFKNIKNNDEQLFNKVKTYLENFDFSHPFDLEGMTADKKISDVLEKLRKNLKNQFSQEYNRIKIDMSGYLIRQ